MINNKTKEEMVKKSNQPHGIKIPTTVEEFRQNLKNTIGVWVIKVYIFSKL